MPKNLTIAEHVNMNIILSITCTIPVERFKIPIIPESVVHTFNLFIKPLYSSLQSSKAIAVDCSSSFYPVNICYRARNDFFLFLCFPVY